MPKEVNVFCRKRLTSFAKRGYPLLAKEVNLFCQKRLTYNKIFWIVNNYLISIVKPQRYDMKIDYNFLDFQTNYQSPSEKLSDGDFSYGDGLIGITILKSLMPG